jgi:hypothetical protein
MAAFITLHSLPAEHFVSFEQVLQDYSVPSYTIFGDVAKSALKGKAPFYDLDLLDKTNMEGFAEEIAKVCECAQTIFVAIGHESSGYILKAIQDMYGDSKRVIVYYDNPESFVPGGYSVVAQSAIALGRPKEILFANKNLAFDEVEVCKGLDGIKRVGLGFYSMEQIEMLRMMRADRKKEGRVFIYLGGSETNTEYMDKAFPAFLDMIQKMSFEKVPTTILFRGHPRSSGLDFAQLQAISKPGLTVQTAPKDLLTSLSLADYAFYYQTSLSPLLVLGGVNPIQVGHEVYHETLVDRGIIPVATTFEEVERIVGGPFFLPSDEVVYDAIGYDPKWQETLLSCLLERVK